MKNFRIVNNVDAHVSRLSEQDSFFPRSRRNRTPGTVKEAPQEKRALAAKKLEESNTQTGAKRVEVNSFYFTSGKSFKSFPARITLGDQQFSFKSGLQMLVHRGEEVVRLFSMTDGLTNYRLRQEADQWTLIGLEPAL